MVELDEVSLATIRELRALDGAVKAGITVEWRPVMDRFEWMGWSFHWTGFVRISNLNETLIGYWTAVTARGWRPDDPSVLRWVGFAVTTGGKQSPYGPGDQIDGCHGSPEEYPMLTVRSSQEELTGRRSRAWREMAAIILEVPWKMVQVGIDAGDPAGDQGAVHPETE